MCLLISRAVCPVNTELASPWPSFVWDDSQVFVCLVVLDLADDSMSSKLFQL